MQILANPMDRRHSRAPVLLALAAAWATAACSSEGESCPEQRYTLEDALGAHACSHVVDGPFDTVSAAPTLAGAPELRNTHVAYTVELLPDGNAYRGVVTFRPRSTAPFVFFLDAAPPLVVTGPDGELCAAAVRPTTNICEGLTRADFYDLDRLATYTLSLGPADAADLLVIVEAMEEM